ncbi:MAG TPA: hypothetical protein VHP63_02380 [candidate division Zixibacteria bacterium]|nr:hypothetical protein [candidate division Zixibacteria bacterium]
MRRITISILVLLFSISSVLAGRQKDMSGTVENDVYKDKKYNFTLGFSEAWKYTLQKNEDNFRLLLTQRNYDIPPSYINAPDYTQIPRIVLWTDTTSLDAFAFLDSLVSEAWRSEQKKEMLKEFEILSSIPASGTRREAAIPRGRKPVDIGGEQGILWQAKSKYVKEIELSAGAQAGTRINGAYGGAIVAVKHEGRVLVFHFMSEWDFFDAVLNEVLKIIGSLSFEGNAKPAEKVGSDG